MSVDNGTKPSREEAWRAWVSSAGVSGELGFEFPSDSLDIVITSALDLNSGLTIGERETSPVRHPHPYFS